MRLAGARRRLPALPGTTQDAAWPLTTSTCTALYALTLGAGAHERSKTCTPASKSKAALSSASLASFDATPIGGVSGWTRCLVAVGSRAKTSAYMVGAASTPLSPSSFAIPA
eukprot:CAMPEP_0181210248 /NCGR_PEP_ID=MMETSP1096-20121128/23124_1 /TAXON_ID=156174 ORGANISM="Chrysochromulina ericina, Strain CCMP281" /NCGR_SAMPLE_ID=MMETSP1096 /ASSEMBLY_ACC=CAM_ASM_000453 /LENGTH=111 /DNA_ID=CAMNT_0023301515 /DNA_START=188 /DNA_END=523 /DNA_ORIENTATION=+